MSNVTNFAERKLLGNLFQIFHEPSFSSTRAWLERNIRLTAQQSSKEGMLQTKSTPWMYHFLDLLDDPEASLIVGRKSSRIAWTTYINGYIGKTVEEDKLNIAVGFPKDDMRKKYFRGFLKPMLLTTPSLETTIKKYCNINKLNYKFVQFDNCALTLLNLRTASETKTDYFARFIAEEPSEIIKDVGGQGNPLKLVLDRLKTASMSKIIIGGTPTELEFCQTSEFFNLTNQKHLHAHCHKCGQLHAITKREAWENFKFNKWPSGEIHDIYGQYNPDTVMYLCPFCQEPWNFDQKNKNIIEGLNFFEKGWKAERPEIKNAHGLQFSELVSNFEGCKFEAIAKELLAAKHQYDKGYEMDMKKIVNTKMGMPYSPLQTGVTVDELEKKRLSYAEWIVHQEGFILTCGIDKQRGGASAQGRFELVVRAWGRNGNSWLVAYHIIYGNTQDYSDSVWERLTEFVCDQEFKHASGKLVPLKISVVGIDAGDDTELVYRWVKDITSPVLNDYGDPIAPPRFNRPVPFGSSVHALKGVSSKYDGYDIYNEPGTIEAVTGAQQRKSLAEKMGVNLYLVGSYRSNEELQRRINLVGTRDRFYHCETGHPGYERSLLSCTKTFEGYDSKGYWKQIPGWPKEVRDCERYNLWCYHAHQINQYTAANWSVIEYSLLDRSKM